MSNHLTNLSNLVRGIMDGPAPLDEQQRDARLDRMWQFHLKLAEHAQSHRWHGRGVA